MPGFSDITPRQIFLRLGGERERLRALLATNGLALEEDIEYAVGLEDGEGRLVGCGCRAGAVLKCFAVDPALRGENLLGRLLSALSEQAFAEGCTRLRIFTSRDKARFFQASGFHLLAQAASTALLENVKDGPERFAKAHMARGDGALAAGAVVMNCNPFTNGHRHLVEHARSRCELLYLFLVEEDRSAFPFAVRRRLVEAGTADIPGIRIVASGPYIISAATFPTYFLKESAAVNSEHAELDATLFARRVAPAFRISRRFVGEEPSCAVTRSYNAALARILPAAGLDLEIIPRLAVDAEPVSASAVRREIVASGVGDATARMVPPSTFEFLRSEEAEPILKRLSKYHTI